MMRSQEGRVRQRNRTGAMVSLPVARSAVSAWWLAVLLLATIAASGTASASGSESGGRVRLGGELRTWHAIAVEFDGPTAAETDTDPNPFTDYRLTVEFRHESGPRTWRVPGYFAADGVAADSGAAAGNRWRAHFVPDRVGRWHYRVEFVRGLRVAVEESGGTPVAPFDGETGTFRVRPTNKTGVDLRARGRLEYVGRHHLRFAGSGEYFLKAGPDAPETLLAYADFDGTEPGRARVARAGEAVPTPGLHRYAPHLGDWRPGDPTWRRGRGRGLVGALNYLAASGMNTVSFLPYNAGGDGDNVWPFIARDRKLHYDCSKLEQWRRVFEHATTLGLHLHFKLQENEIDDNRVGEAGRSGVVPEALDGGLLGIERRLYCRELVARFSHLLALTWNLGEENTQSAQEQRDMALCLQGLDPYDHPIVVHTFPNRQEAVYEPLLGAGSVLSGASLQNGWDRAHERTWHWLEASARAGRPWVVANDEQNPASAGVPPDPGYAGNAGVVREGPRSYTLHDIRKHTLWGTLMAGGGGVEYYFGYELPQNDLDCEDFRSRDRSWGYARHALDFFRRQRVPFWEMTNADELVGNALRTNSRYCLALPGRLYLVYLPVGGEATLDLTGASGVFRVGWFNPRIGGPLQRGRVEKVRGGQTVTVGPPPAEIAEDWLVVVRRD